MKFFDLCVKPGSYEEARKMAQFSIQLGFSGLCVISSLKDIEKLRTEFPQLKILSGFEIKKPGETAKLFDIVFARSRDIKFNRIVAKTKGINILLDPYDTATCIFNQVIARICRDNGVSVGISFNSLIHQNKLTRSNLLKSIMELSDILIEYNVPLRLVSGAVNQWDLRSPSELISFGRILGFGDPEIKKAISL